MSQLFLLSIQQLPLFRLGHFSLYTYVKTKPILILMTSTSKWSPGLSQRVEVDWSLLESKNPTSPHSRSMYGHQRIIMKIVRIMTKRMRMLGSNSQNEALVISQIFSWISTFSMLERRLRRLVKNMKSKWDAAHLLFFMKKECLYRYSCVWQTAVYDQRLKKDRKLYVFISALNQP